MKKAAALGYDPERDRAPKVLAKGIGRLAERIIAVAKEYDVPIYEDSALIDILVKLDYYEEIPEELYKAIAEILIFVYTKDIEYGKKYVKQGQKG
ncbi:MAG: EscU/YscU/HrcU family type III secretion system export apparatus switch protein [Thermotogae bacterium]|nr:EscU/YscU/HrcU family type III secretion system export apparatus switch protein [Thermotogota bacterium]